MFKKKTCAYVMEQVAARIGRTVDKVADAVLLPRRLVQGVFEVGLKTTCPNIAMAAISALASFCSWPRDRAQAQQWALFVLMQHVLDGRGASTLLKSDALIEALVPAVVHAAMNHFITHPAVMAVWDRVPPFCGKADAWKVLRYTCPGVGEPWLTALQAFIPMELDVVGTVAPWQCPCPGWFCV